MIQVEYLFNMFESFRKTIANIISPHKQAMTIPTDFLRYGRANTLSGNWSELIMRDEQKYKDYSYGAITRRASAVARVASDKITTKSEDENAIHPYLKLIDDSPTFSNNQFWESISTYLDMKGIFYLMAIRSKNGRPTEFKLLNPYSVVRVLNPENLEVTGYIEEKGQLQRDIPPHMIIEMRKLNPFDNNEAYSMVDAAQETQFTLATAGDYTRHAMKGNINAPGVISTDVILPNEEFQNFKKRINEHTKGEPIYGNGSGAVTWTPMTTDLSKAALKDVNETERDRLFATLGVSKTIMGIEQSGTTRETANVQKDLHLETQILPQIQIVIDALNQDYKNNYSKSSFFTEAEKKMLIFIDSPVEADHEAEIKEIESKDKKIDLYKKMRDSGYSHDVASKYVKGELDVDDLGEPTEEVKEEVVEVLPTEKPKKKVNLMTNDLRETLIDNQRSMLQNAVINVEEQLVVAAINRVPKLVSNAIDEESDLITSSEKKRSERELAIILAGFYGIIMTIQGPETIKERVEKYGKDALFKLSKSTRQELNAIADKSAQSHIDTISNELYEVARKASLDGLGQQQIIAKLKEEYTGTIANTRAKTIARTEANRAFTMAQFEADKQFIDQNNLNKRAYKQWRTHSDKPCPFCEELAGMGPVPFEQNFKDLGSTITVGKGKAKKTLKVDFLDLEAGGAHPNCNCDYLLIIQ